MIIKREIYDGRKVDILYPEEGYLLECKETGLLYSAVSLENGRKENDYKEVKENDSERKDS